MNTIMIKLTFHYSAIKPSVKSNFYKNKYQLTFHYSAIKPKNFLGTLDLAFKLTFHYSAIKPKLVSITFHNHININIPL